MINNNAAFKYYMLYKGPFGITQYRTNITVILQCGVVNIRYNIHHIKPCKSDIKVENIIDENDI